MSDRLISADSLWMTIIHAMDYCEDILEFIEKEPEAVVRCKDCVHYWKNKPTDDIPVCLASPRDDAYCSEGERREDAKTN